MCILQKMVLDYLASCLMIEQIDILFWWSCRYYLIVMIEQIDILFSLPFISSVSALKLLGFRFYYISGRVSVHSVEVPLQNWSLISVEVPLHWSLASYLLDIVTTNHYRHSATDVFQLFVCGKPCLTGSLFFFCTYSSTEPVRICSTSFCMS